MPALDYDAFRRSVKKGEILPAYYFHGDEDLLKDDAIRQVLEAAVDPSSRDYACAITAHWRGESFVLGRCGYHPTDVRADEAQVRTLAKRL